MAMTVAREGIERLELVPAATLFRSLGDLSRLAIVRRLAQGPARVTDLVAALGLAQSTVSKHLACLRDCGLVASEPVGRASVFRLTQPSLIDVLAAAEEVLAATGSAVALCPHFGSGGKAGSVGVRLSRCRRRLASVGMGAAAPIGARGPRPSGAAAAGMTRCGEPGCRRGFRWGTWLLRDWVPSSRQSWRVRWLCWASGWIR